MTPFRSTPAGFAARWEPVERQVLARVARDVAGLVRADAGLPEDVDPDSAFTGVPRVPVDPAVQRLLPDAHRDDAEAAAEFRHLTQTDLAAGKVRRLEEFARRVGGDDEDAPPEGQVLVPREDAEAFAGALTDVRLVLAERLSLEDDDAVERLHDAVVGGETDDLRPPEGMDAEQWVYWGGVFVAAGFAQESLMDELLSELRARRPR
ncbi:uncharacterized protein DUF2017 [Isoptericola jiangsuensis]|uniref:Uncharacterized protein DUF2017 n=1 Tax=Isoptericola jiangsuensis TaxID=548579 RepID=A0A2A9EUM0_9MICO|nr:DUF2017 family protein [Isoptericola jiangsuensis]PFG42578.1 uncharacterized protein DUF2017 [Isoptericola jiangsuensis]